MAIFSPVTPEVAGSSPVTRVSDFRRLRVRRKAVPEPWLLSASERVLKARALGRLKMAVQTNEGQIREFRPTPCPRYSLRQGLYRPLSRREHQSLTEHLQRFVGQNERGDLAACYVALSADGKVVGYYTLSAHAILRAELSDEQAKGIPRHDRIPAFLIGRLTRDISVKGQGLGEFLLMDALARLAAVQAAGRAVVMDPIDQRASQFYGKYGFVSLSGATARLYLPMSAVRNALT